MKSGKGMETVWWVLLVLIIAIVVLIIFVIFIRAGILQLRGPFEMIFGGLPQQ